ncbi:MAG: head-tail connector protein [Thermoleophilia bacterium]
MKAYATAAEYKPFSGQDAPADFDRLSLRASELIDNSVTEMFDVDDTDKLPTDVDVAAAMRDACCAQVEFWAEVGEENDIDGLAGTKVSAGAFAGDRAPELSPRAARILGNAGLIR